MSCSKIRELLLSRYPQHTWCLVQERSLRSVYRLDRAAKPDYFVKIYHPGGPLAKLRNLLRPRTLHEVDMLRRLKACGLSVPEVKDHLRLKASSALVTKAVHPCRPLHELDRSRQAEIMLDTAVKLLSRGFYFSDMHLGNIVLDDNGSPYLLDAYEVKECRVIRRRHIISLFAQVLAVYDVADEEIKNALVSVTGHHQIETLLEEIRTKALHSRRRYVKKLVNRCLSPGIFTREIRTKDARAYVFAGRDIDLEDLLRRHQENIARKTKVLKLQNKTQLTEVGDCCIKTYRPPRPLCPEYALRSWKGLLTLYFNGIGVADPVAVGLFSDRSSVLVTGMLHYPDLDCFFHSAFRDLSFGDKAELVSSFGEMIGSMHALNIYHADLKACNIKIDTEELRFSLLDTDRIKQGRPIRYAKRLKNLVQINTSVPVHISSSMRMRFLRSYAGYTGDDPKILFRDVWKISAGREILYCTPEGDRTDTWRCSGS